MNLSFYPIFLNFSHLRSESQLISNHDRCSINKFTKEKAAAFVRTLNKLFPQLDLLDASDEWHVEAVRKLAVFLHVGAKKRYVEMNREIMGQGLLDRHWMALYAKYFQPSV